MEHELIHPKKNALVVQHNRLVEGRYDLTLQEIRLIFWLISEIKPNDKSFKTYRVPIKELAEFVGIEKNKNIYQQMIDITARLMSRVVRVWSDNKKTLELMHWVSYAKYEEGAGYADFRLSDDLVPYLIELKKNFTKHDLFFTLRMKSVYAVRIYTLLKQYEKIGERTITINELREYCGIIPKQYSLYADLRINLIMMAQREINTKTDIRFDYFEIKTGRKVTALRFVIDKNKQVESQPDEFFDTDMQPIEILDNPKPTDSITNDPKLAKLLSSLIGCGLQEAKAREYIENHPIDRLEWAVEELARLMKSKKTKIENPTGWLVKAIEEGWEKQTTVFDAERKQKEAEREAKAEADRKRRERLAEIEPTVSKIRKGYTTYTNATIYSFTSTMDRDDRITIERAFSEFLRSQKGSEFIASRFDGGRSWYEDRLVRPYAIKYLSENCPEFMLASLDDYAKRQSVENFEALDAEYEVLKKVE